MGSIWEWWIFCKACGAWRKGNTKNFPGWKCLACGSGNIKAGYEYVGWEPESWEKGEDNENGI